MSLKFSIALILNLPITSRLCEVAWSAEPQRRTRNAIWERARMPLTLDSPSDERPNHIAVCWLSVTSQLIFPHFFFLARALLIIDESTFYVKRIE